MSWFDDETLAVGSIPQGKGGITKEDVYFWHYGDKSTTLAASAADIWCAHDGNFSYEKFLTHKDGKFFLGIHEKNAAGEKDFTVDIVKTPGMTSLPILYTSPDHQGYNPKFFRSTEKFNPFDCSWTSSTILADVYPEYDWVYLRPGDGIIAFNGSLTEIKGLPTKVLHYKNIDSEPVTLAIPPASARTLKIRSVNYYPFHHAYFIAEPWIFGVKSDDSRCEMAWWFTADNDEVSQVCLPYDFLANQREVAVTPSAKGLLRFLPVFGSPQHPGGSPGGVYLTDEKGTTRKIWEGIADSGVVSPNGCLVAVNTSLPVILDLCH
jgi:hypothetical protein